MILSQRLSLAASILLLVITGCTKESSTDIQPDLTIFGFDNLEEARVHLGSYADIFQTTNGTMRIRSTTLGSNELETAEIFARYRTESLAPESNGGEFIFGDIELNFDESSQSYSLDDGEISNDEKIEKINSLFGINNQFSIVKDGDIIAESEMYVPQKLKISLENAFEFPGQSVLAASRSNCQIQWNSDNSNSEGLVAYLNWQGHIVTESVFEQEDSFISKAVKMTDNGSTTIPQELFTGIPENALVTVFFIRGAVDVLNNQSHSFKFYCVTQDKHTFIVSD